MNDPHPDETTPEPDDATAGETDETAAEEAGTPETPEKAATSDGKASGTAAAPVAGAVTLTKGGVSGPSRRTPSRTVLVAVAAVVVLVAAGLVGWLVLGGDDDAEEAEDNGIASRSLEQIGTDVNAAMADLSSVHLVVDRGTGPSQLQIDLRISDAGECAGSFSGGGVTTEILSVDDRVFLRPDEGYWAAAGLSPEAAAEIVATADGRWIEGSADTGSSSLLGICTDGIESLAGDEFDPTTFADAGWSIGEEGDVDGVPALALQKTGGTTAWIATEGPPWILLAQSEGDETGSVRFSEHDEPIDLAVPADDEIVTEAELLPATQ